VARLRVTVTDGRGRPVRAPGLAGWLRRSAPPGARGAVAIALIGDAAMRRLNREFRGSDHATDVLSFPVGQVEHRGSRRGGRRSGSGRPGEPASERLGDIAIALGVARRQARDHRHGLSMELRVLALHGLLHLLGYDHETDQGQMRRLEERIRRRAGLRSGVIARARADARR